MSRLRFSVVRTAGVAWAIGLAGACATVDVPNAPDVQEPGLTSDLAGMLVTCEADAHSGTLDCGHGRELSAPTPPTVVLGGQGIYVELGSTNASYNAGTGIFQADVSIRNRLAQKLGTPDGSTVTGLKVFFHDQPSSTAGGGTVTVLNPDGPGTFTGSNQPYFEYSEIVDTNLTSSSKTWKWQLAGGAQTFTFTVLIQADVPEPEGVWRWGLVNTGTNRALRGIYGFSASDIFAVGNCTCAPDGIVLHYNGVSWSSINNVSVPHNLVGVWGTSGADVFVVGNGSTILHYNGSSWSQQAAPIVDASLRGVWGTGSQNVFVVGRNGKILHYDGSSWAEQTSPVATDLFGVWGTSSTNVYAVGFDGKILHFDGSDWTVATTIGTTVFRGIWGSSDGDIFVVGGNGTVARFDGTSWTAQVNVGSLTELLSGVRGRSPTDVFAVGEYGRVVHYDGVTWRVQRTGQTTPLNSLWAASATNVFAVGGDFHNSNVDGIMINGIH